MTTTSPLTPSPFVYSNGDDNIEIRRDADGWVCLTDMWRAAGASKSKETYAFLRSTRTVEIIEAMSKPVNFTGLPVGELIYDFTEADADPHGKKPQGRNLLLLRQQEGEALVSGFVRKDRGRDGNTWASFALAVEYARYLSVDFHVWMLGLAASALTRYEREAAEWARRQIEDDASHRLEDMDLSPNGSLGHLLALCAMSAVDRLASNPQLSPQRVRDATEISRAEAEDPEDFRTYDEPIIDWITENRGKPSWLAKFIAILPAWEGMFMVDPKMERDGFVNLERGRDVRFYMAKIATDLCANLRAKLGPDEAMKTRDKIAKRAFRRYVPEFVDKHAIEGPDDRQYLLADLNELARFIYGLLHFHKRFDTTAAERGPRLIEA